MGMRAARQKASVAAPTSTATSSGSTCEPALEIDPEMQQEEIATGHVAIAIRAQPKLAKGKSNGVSHPAPKGGKRAAMKKAALAKQAAEAEAAAAAAKVAEEVQCASEASRAPAEEVQCASQLS